MKNAGNNILHGKTKAVTKSPIPKKGNETYNPPGKYDESEKTLRRKSSGKQSEMIGTTGKSTSKTIGNTIVRKKQDSWFMRNHKSLHAD
jgi:hypothetical protein